MNFAKLSQRALIAASLVAFSTTAQAHPSHASLSGALSGAAHPLTGLDHMLAMLAVGLWAAQMGGRAIWAVPASFVALMCAGGALGWAGISLPLVEPAILASIIVLGLAITAATRAPMTLCAALAGVFALFHGHAHGLEMPSEASRLGYAAGFIFSTAALHAAGIGLGLLSQHLKSPALIRYAGACIVAAGAWLSLAH